jgi:uncharacterized membrane protein
MSESFQVVFTGKLHPGKDAEQVIDRFSEKFKMERGKVELLIRSARSVVLKKGLDQEKAGKYLAVLRHIGMQVELDPKLPGAAPPEPKAPEVPPVVAEPPPPPPPPPVVSKAPSRLALEPLDNGGDDSTEILDPKGPNFCPKCGSTQMRMGICQACGIVASKYMASMGRKGQYQEEDSSNPYTSPEADLVESLEGEMNGPRAVAVGNSIAWITQGWGYFKTSPLAWILAMVVWFVISMVVGLIPFVGGLALTLVGPVIMAGFLLGCHEQEEGGEFSVSHLFAGFSQNAGQLVLVGLYYLVMMVVVGLIVGLGMFFSLGGMNMAFEDPQAMTGGGIGIGFILLMILVFIIMIGVVMSYIFAPALVVFDDLNAFEAMKLSFKGSLMNLLPLLVYVLVAAVLMVLGAIPLFLGLLVVLPMLTASNYAAYRDIYYA